jgi:hypothetical protein
VPDLFDGDTDVSDFELPGDSNRVGAAVAEPEPASSEPQENAPEGRPRNDKGQFLPKQEDAEPAEPEPQPQAQPEPLLLGKFKTPEALAESYQHLERQFHDQQRLLAEQRQQFQPQPAPSQVDYMALSETDPVYAIEAANEAGDQAAVLQIAQQWKADDPYSYGVFVNQKRLEAQYQQQNQIIQTREQQIAADQANRVYAAFQQAHPDVDQYVPDMVRVAEQAPWLLQNLEHGDAATKAGVLRTLYLEAKAGTSDQTSDNLRDAVRAGARDAEAERQEAATVVSTAAEPADRPQQSVADRIASEWDDPQDDGWNL